MDITPFITNNSMLRTQASNLLALHNFSTSAQELSNYPLLLNGVNGSPGSVGPGISPNPSFIATSLSELGSIKTEKNVSPELTPTQKYEQVQGQQQRCPNKSSDDAEGVWSPDIEKAFQEAIETYPPCGRRKIIFASEGKMYGRNELIARYIRDKTGKSRTRKQVSSHIQVLARKKSKEIQQQSKDNEMRQQLLERFSTMSSAQIVNEDIHERSVKRSRESPPTAPYYPKVTEIKAECKMSSPKQQQPPLQPPTAAHPTARSTLPTLPFIKTESPPDKAAAAAAAAAATTVAMDFMMGSTTQAGGLNSYFPASLQNIAFPRTLSSIVDTSFSVTRAPRAQPVVASPNSLSSTTEQRLKMLKFNGYMEKRDRSWRHFFVDLNTDTEFADPNLERIDIEKIHDKFKEFPSGEGSLLELFHAGPRQAFFLIKFWVNLNSPTVDPKGTDVFYGHDNRYESTERLHIKVSTKACSFGKGVVEKTQTVTPVATDGRLIYDVDKSPLCDYLINFIFKLKGLPDAKLMNNVLENFTILQHVTDVDTGETLLCVACMFEVSETNESQYSIYRLVGH